MSRKTHIQSAFDQLDMNMKATVLNLARTLAKQAEWERKMAPPKPAPKAKGLSPLAINPGKPVRTRKLKPAPSPAPNPKRQPRARAMAAPTDARVTVRVPKS